MSKEYSIQRAAPDRYSEVIHLIHTTIKSCYPAIYPAEVVHFFLEYHSPEQLTRRANSGLLVILETEGKIKGTGFLDSEEMGGVYIHPDFQRLGYGTAIINYLLDEAESKNLPRVWLDATPIARPLYEKLGFRVVKTLCDRVGNSELNYFLMEKVL